MYVVVIVVYRLLCGFLIFFWSGSVVLVGGQAGGNLVGDESIIIA
jgi:hypothetical protein